MDIGSAVFIIFLLSLHAAQGDIIRKCSSVSIGPGMANKENYREFLTLILTVICSVSVA